jgi:hypothetical protein
MAGIAELLWQQNVQPVPQRNDSDASRFIVDALMEAGGKLGVAPAGIAQALMAPGNALRGEYAPGIGAQTDPRMVEDAASLAGLVSLGAAPIPRPMNSIGMGGKPNFPSSEYLLSPPIPSADLMGRFSKVEPVPFAQMRSTNKLQWDRFNSAEHPPELIGGYADRPVMIRMENGEYLIIDGHHRAALAATDGGSMDAYVINAKDYAPGEAGRRKPAADLSDIDDLMKELGL